MNVSTTPKVVRRGAPEMLRRAQVTMRLEKILWECDGDGGGFGSARSMQRMTSGVPKSGAASEFLSGCAAEKADADWGTLSSSLAF